MPRPGYLLSGAAPPTVLAEWLEDHPAEYPRFARLYADWLAADRPRAVALPTARWARQYNYTLLHDSNRPSANVATALRQVLEMDAREGAPREWGDPQRPPSLRGLASV